MTTKQLLTVLVILFSINPMTSLFAQETHPKAAALFTNARIFDGKSEQLGEGMSVLVEGNMIAKIAKTIPAPSGVTESVAKGKTLMPGLSDTHWHTMFNATLIPTLMSADMSYLMLIGATSAEQTLMRGFTTVRDIGGNPFGIKRAIDEGMIPGPRIYPPGPMISQTSGHSGNRPTSRSTRSTWRRITCRLNRAAPIPGKLGMLDEGALADLILVNGNPLESPDLVADPENNFAVIMKGGVLYKNTIS